MNLPIYQVDAFTGKLFGGNPAAVVICKSTLSSELMQAIAAENNLSETAFVEGREGALQIRWFTPAVEVDLCGHATLAAAHVLFIYRGFAAPKVTFSSKSGPLHVRREGEVLYLDFPADLISAVEPPEELIRGLGERPSEVYRGRDDYLAVFDSEAQIAALNPDMAQLSRVPSRGVIASAKGSDVDFVSRFFAPRVGISEDPVTGSAHTTLIPYWSARLSKKEMRAKQISKRGGELICRNLGERVEIGGRAVTYMTGEIRV